MKLFGTYTANKLEELNKSDLKCGIFYTDYEKAGYLIGAVHGRGILIICPSDYTVEDVKMAYVTYATCCELLDIEPKSLEELLFDGE